MAMKLTSTFVETVTVAATDKPKRYTDANQFGLSLLVKHGAHGVCKSWSQFIRINRKPRSIGLGKYPTVRLTDARRMARANHLAATNGDTLPHDGMLARNTIDTNAGMPTFAEVAEATIAARAPKWTGNTERNWRSTLGSYVFPKLGDKRIDLITQSDVIDVIMPIWHRPSGKQTRQRIDAIMKHAMSREYRTTNPAGEVIAGALVRGKVSTEHRASLHYSAVAGALATVRAIETSGWRGMTLAFEFAVHTAARSEETLGARWDEIDTDAAVWTIPASRMKAGREHTIPLSRQALAIVEAARALGSIDGFVFRGITKPRAPDGSLKRVRDAAGLECTVHGFRNSFGDWCVETAQDDVLSELALAHVSDRTKRAYKRTDAIERRRAMMQAWSDHVAS